MPQAIANPEELERFARELASFNATLRERMTHLQGRYSALGETWRDQEEAKFAREFEQTVRVLHQFMRTADQHIPFLHRKAQRIRDYLNQR